MTLEQLGALLVMIATWNQAAEGLLVMGRHMRLAARDGLASAERRRSWVGGQHRSNVEPQRLTWARARQGAGGSGVLARRDKFFGPELDFVDWQRGVVWLQLAVGATLLSVGTLDLRGSHLVLFLLATLASVLVTQASRHSYLADQRKRQAALPTPD